MPQFDLFCFSTQVFWVMVIFFSFYFLFSQVFLSQFAATLKLRGKRLHLREHQDKGNSLLTFPLFVLYLVG